MTDKEKVVEGLKWILYNDRFGFGVNWDHGEPQDEEEQAGKYIWDALTLLKEQEAEWIYGEEETGVDGYRCSECNFFEPWFYEFDGDIDFIKRYEHCPKCGRKMISYTGK